MWTLQFDRFVWLAPSAFALHEAEEWNILSWYHRHWNNVGDLSNRIVWTWLVFIALLGFAITWLGTRSRRPRLTAHLVILFFAFPFLHGFLHVYWVFYFGGYSPGVLSSIFLLIPACAALAVRAVRDRLASLWFVVFAVFVNLPPFVAAIRMGDTLPDAGLPFYRFSEAIARLLFGSS